MRTRVGFVFFSSHDITDYFDLVRGWEIVIYDYSQYLLKKGYEPIWISCVEKDVKVKEKFDGIIVRSVKKVSSFYPESLNLLIKLIKTIETENISILYTRASSIGFIAALACKITRIPFIFHVEDLEADIVTRQKHGILQNYLSRFLMLFLQKGSIFMSKKVIIVSESFKDFLVSNWNVPEGKIIVVYEGVERTSLAPPISSTPHRIIYVGGTSFYDGIDILLRAYAKLANKIENTELTIATFPPKHEVSRFKKLCSSLGLNNKVGFVSSITGQTARELVRNSYIGVISRRRTLSTDLTTSAVIFLYLSEGVPVVAPRLKAITEIIRNPSLLFEPENSDSLSKTLAEIMLNEKLREDLRNYVMKLRGEFDRNKMCERFVGIIEQEVYE